MAVIGGQVCEASPGAISAVRRQTGVLIRMLKNLALSGYAPEHDVSGLTDPFLQVPFSPSPLSFSL